MRANSSFIVKLVRSARAGPVLQIVSGACLVTVLGMMDRERPATTTLKMIWGAMIVTGVLGSYLSSKASAKRRARRHAGSEITKED